MSTTEIRPARTDTDAGVAQRLEAALRPFVGGDLPVRLTAWDGSVAGPGDAPAVRLRTPDVLRRLLWHPGELGAAQAYVTGELDVEGDLDAALTHVWAWSRRARAERGPANAREPWPRCSARRARSVRLGLPPAPPRSQARVRGRLHSLARDRPSISHHYDLSNEFYALILDPHMAYSCGYYDAPRHAPSRRRSAPSSTWSAASSASSRASGSSTSAAAGARCRLHAAEHFGAQVTGVTIAAEQKAFIDARIAERGLRRPGRDPAAGLPRRPGRPVRRRRVDRDGRARRRGATTRRTSRCCAAPSGRGGRVLVQQMSRRGRRHPGRRPVHRVVHRPRHAHAPGGRDRGATSRRAASRCATCTSCASTTSPRSATGWPASRPTWSGSRARRRGGAARVAALPRRRRAGLP